MILMNNIICSYDECEMKALYKCLDLCGDCFINLCEEHIKLLPQNNKNKKELLPD